MKYFFQSLFFLILYVSILYPADWTILKSTDIMPYDSITGKQLCLNSNKITFYQDQMAMSRLTLLDDYKIINRLVLLIYNGKNWKYYYENDIKKLFKDSTIYSNLQFKSGVAGIEYDSKGNLWGFTRYGVFKFDGNSFSGFSTTCNKEYTDSINAYTKFLKIDKFDNPWLITVDDPAMGFIYYVCKYDYKFKDGAFIRLREFSYPPGTARINTKGLSPDINNQMWHIFLDTIQVIKSWGGIERKIGYYSLFAEDGFLTNVEVSNKNTKYFLNNSWSLYIYDDSTWKKDTYLYSIEHKQNFNNSEVTENFMCTDSSGNLWVSYNDWHELFKYSPNGNWTIYKIPVDSDSNNYNWTKNHIQIDKIGRVWLSCPNYGLYMLDINSTSVDFKIENSLFHISPNPVTDFLQINSKQSDKIEIFSALGLKVLETEWKEKIDVSSLSSGVYIIRVGNKVSKFIKL